MITPEIGTILLALAAIIISAVISHIVTSYKVRKKVTYMLDALEDKELNFRFNEEKLTDRKLNRTLNRLRNIFDKERKEILQKEKFYGEILDNITTGIVIIEEKGYIQYCNKTALNLLSLATFSNLRQLRSIGDSLYDAFVQVTESHEEKVSYHDESGTRKLLLNATKAILSGKEFQIITLNDISSEINDNQQESYTRLIRVLTHEIMNTITPIASLSKTLSGYLHTNYEPSEEISLSEKERLVREGLETITQSSNGLIKFVDSYRSLTRIATPIKKVIALNELIESILHLVKPELEASSVAVTYEENSNNILLYADSGQITQIIINIIKNAIQAEATRIAIKAQIDNKEGVIIDITNNGRQISKESRDEIFVPFYTTKPEGTGIGLSISRQIMRLHNGSLTLTQSTSAETTFTLYFK